MGSSSTNRSSHASKAHHSIANVSFDPSNVNLQTADPKEVFCYYTALSDNDYSSENSHNTARLSSIFVLLIISTAATMFPVLAARVKWLRIPLYVFLMIRYFGAGVIIATAFIHLLDPAYSEIGPQTCVGMTGSWTKYSWPPAIAMTSAMVVFLFDFIIECHVQEKLGLKNVNIHGDVEATVTIHPSSPLTTTTAPAQRHFPPPTPHYSATPPPLHDGKPELEHQGISPPSSLTGETTMFDPPSPMIPPVQDFPSVNTPLEYRTAEAANETSIKTSECCFEQQLAAFLVLEFGVIFHSIIIGLNLGVAGTEFRTLYPVLVFHQCFEGMGIGARLSTITFPSRFRLVPWLLCLAFGMTTPIAVAIGLSVRSSYNPESFTADVVSGVFDSVSAGILLYTGFVELLARDFLFHPERSLDKYRVSTMICCLYLGIAIMCLLGKWA